MATYSKLLALVHFLVASRNIARVQCSISSVSEGGGGKVGCSTISHPSIMLSLFPVSEISFAKRKLASELGRLLSLIFLIIGSVWPLSIKALDAMAEFTFHTDLFSS